MTGDYTIGSGTSPMALLTIGDGTADVPIDNVRIAGIMKTENRGLEKVIVNIVSEPRAPFLIVCGRGEFGHSPADALSCLVRNGLDKRGRVIGARSAISYLSIVPREAVERFRRQVEIIDLVHPKDAEEIIASMTRLYEFDAERNAEPGKATRDCLVRDARRFPESPLIVRSRAEEADAGKTTGSIDNMAMHFTS